MTRGESKTKHSSQAVWRGKRKLFLFVCFHADKLCDKQCYVYVNVGLPLRTDSIISHSRLNGTANSMTNSTNITPPCSLITNGRLCVRWMHVVSVCPGELQTLSVGSFEVLYQFVLVNGRLCPFAVSECYISLSWRTADCPLAFSKCHISLSWRTAHSVRWQFKSVILVCPGERWLC